MKTGSETQKVSVSPEEWKLVIVVDESKLRLQRRKREEAGTQGRLGDGSRLGRLLRSLSEDAPVSEEVT